ncbi:hypothetical protein [Aquibium microcysteis]|uniref:hypothetical protein n=1 Tax=Aquibium microcysteis TaxID=675281 RepID=UPI00165D08C1|nr:hypothetical protein [Aquibium microcysteis]
MLKPALIALTMMGCDCDEHLCVPIDAPVRHFATIGECEAALATAVESETGRLYPLLKAQCERQDDADLLVAEAPRETAGDAGRDEGRGVLGNGFAYAGRTGEYLVYRTADGVVAVRDGLGWAIDRVQGGAARALALLAR